MHPSDKAWHVLRSFPLIITNVPTISYATQLLNCCLVRCLFFAELEPTSMCDRGNYFPCKFDVGWLLDWTELDRAQLIYKRLMNKRKFSVLSEHCEVFLFFTNTFLCCKGLVHPNIHNYPHTTWSSRIEQIALVGFGQVLRYLPKPQYNGSIFSVFHSFETYKYSTATSFSLGQCLSYSG